MNMGQYIRKNVWQFAILLTFVVGWSICVFQVDETERAVVLQLGKPVWETDQPGLYAKFPWPFQSASILEKRWMKYDANPRDLQTSDSKLLVVDAMAYFRIANGIKFLQSTQTLANAQARVDDVVYSELRNDLGRRKLEDIVVKDRNSIMEAVTRVSSEQLLRENGLEVGVARISKTDFPKENKASVYSRMKAERERTANQYRSEGLEQATRIRAETDREVTTLLAEARETAERNKGQGDAEATRIYNEAYGKDAVFFRTYRGLEAARKALAGKETDVRIFQSGDEPHLRALFGKGLASPGK